VAVPTALKEAVFRYLVAEIKIVNDLERAPLTEIQAKSY